jgi:predicted phosphoadenosine phosphosulfate sulfurtransferase
MVITGKARPHYLLPGNVYDAAKKRIRWLMDEFDGNVSASTSGGKDSTVVTELLAEVCDEMGAGPAKLHFLDQEAEYQATIDYMHTLLPRSDVHLDWYQIPFRLFNATNYEDEWLNVWDQSLATDPSDPHCRTGAWIRDKHPSSITTNEFRKGRTKLNPQGHVIDRFKEVLGAMNAKDGGAILTGMRCEESPTRRVFMTSHPSYKWVTWASAGKPAGRYYLFHPIYDWSYRDVWKAIHDNGWTYNSFYDSMFQYGVPLRNMRVSSFHHELSMASLDYLQELEPATWEAATKRLNGLNAYAHVGETQYKERSILPYMFDAWDEYVYFLIDKLIPEKNRHRFHAMIERALRVLPHIPRDDVFISISSAVLGNDVYGTSVDQWISVNLQRAKPDQPPPLPTRSPGVMRTAANAHRSASIPLIQPASHLAGSAAS